MPAMADLAGAQPQLQYLPENKADGKTMPSREPAFYDDVSADSIIAADASGWFVSLWTVP